MSQNLRSRLFAVGAVIVLFCVVAQVRSQPASDGRDADRAAIKVHIESICQAFVDSDVDKIFSTHSEDWRGFLEGSRTPIKGVEEYMRANGIPWPWPKETEKPKPDPTRGANGFTVKDFDVIFYAPDLAVANFSLDFERRETGSSKVLTRYHIMDVYAKRKGGWIQVASHTVVDPLWRQQQAGNALTVPPQLREQVLKSREAVWRAYFTNDKPTLEKLIPAELIAMNDSGEWANRAVVFSGAQQLADGGARLIRLEFPKTEMQVYANGGVAIIYTTYLYELEITGKRSVSTGQATEIFVRRGGEWVNPGWHLAADGKK